MRVLRHAFVARAFAACPKADPRRTPASRSRDGHRRTHGLRGTRGFPACWDRFFPDTGSDSSGATGWWRVGLYAGFCSGPCGPLAAIHLGRRLPAGSSGLPGVDRAGPPSPCSALLRMGFTEPSGSPRMLVRSYRTVSPLPVRRANPSPSAVCSLLHFPAGHPDWALPSILPCGVRTFLGRITTPKSGSVRGHPADSPPLTIQSLE